MPRYGDLAIFVTTTDNRQTKLINFTLAHVRGVTRMVGIIDKIHPYTTFSSNRVFMQNCVGMHLVYIIPTILVCLLFDPTIPSYLVMQFFSCFLYLLV